MIPSAYSGALQGIMPNIWSISYDIYIWLEHLLYAGSSECLLLICREKAAVNDDKAVYHLVVDDLPPTPSENDIRSVFGQFGKVKQVKVDKRTHRALVTFSNSKALQMALAADHLRLKGANLRVSLPDDSNMRC